jgi:putative hemolysin
VLGRIGSLEVRLATGAEEIRQAQKLRFEVFFEEMSAAPRGASLLTRQDVDDYDAVCDHLLVLDHEAASEPQVVGTYRLLRQEVAEGSLGFYTAGERGHRPSGACSALELPAPLRRRAAGMAGQRRS